MNATLDPMNPQFIYDAIRKVGTGRATDKAGNEWVVEFRDRHDDDRMSIFIMGPNGYANALTVGEEDFVFTDNTFRVAGAPELVGFMHPVYLRKMRGFTRGNIPTPDIAGPSLP
jgi:hypothetical protein